MLPFDPARPVLAPDRILTDLLRAMGRMARSTSTFFWRISSLPNEIGRFHGYQAKDLHRWF